jgi:hypothetical protein
MGTIRELLGWTACDPDSDRPEQHRFKRPFGEVTSEEGTLRLVRCADCGRVDQIDVNENLDRYRTDE